MQLTFQRTVHLACPCQQLIALLCLDKQGANANDLIYAKKKKLYKKL